MQTKEAENKSLTLCYWVCCIFHPSFHVDVCSKTINEFLESGPVSWLENMMEKKTGQNMNQDGGGQMWHLTKLTDVYLYCYCLECCTNIRHRPNLMAPCFQIKLKWRHTCWDMSVRAAYVCLYVLDDDRSVWLGSIFPLSRLGCLQTGGQVSSLVWPTQ